MKKQAEIRIVDAKRAVTVYQSPNKAMVPYVKKIVRAYRVKSVGKNGEVLETSEVLNDVMAVKTHIEAMNKLWNPSRANHGPIQDHTNAQKFYESGYAAAKPLKK